MPETAIDCPATASWPDRRTASVSSAGALVVPSDQRQLAPPAVKRAPAAKEVPARSTVAPPVAASSAQVSFLPERVAAPERDSVLGPSVS